MPYRRHQVTESHGTVSLLWESEDRNTADRSRKRREMIADGAHWVALALLLITALTWVVLH